MPVIKNPFKLWLLDQPPEITMASLARDLGVVRSHVFGLMKEEPTMPSLPLAAKIEQLTKGAVTVDWFVKNGVSQKRRAA